MDRLPHDILIILLELHIHTSSKFTLHLVTRHTYTTYLFHQRRLLILLLDAHNVNAYAHQALILSALPNGFWAPQDRHFHYPAIRFRLEQALMTLIRGCTVSQMKSVYETHYKIAYLARRHLAETFQYSTSKDGHPEFSLKHLDSTIKDFYNHFILNHALLRWVVHSDGSQGETVDGIRGMLLLAPLPSLRHDQLPATGYIRRALCAMLHEIDTQTPSWKAWDGVLRGRRNWLLRTLEDAYSQSPPKMDVEVISKGVAEPAVMEVTNLDKASELFLYDATLDLVVQVFKAGEGEFGNKMKAWKRYVKGVEKAYGTRRTLKEKVRSFFGIV